MLHDSMNGVVKCFDIVCGVVKTSCCVVRILRSDERVVGHIETSLLCCKDAANLRETIRPPLFVY